MIRQSALDPFDGVVKRVAELVVDDRDQPRDCYRVDGLALQVSCTPGLAPFLSRVRFSRRRMNEAAQVFVRADHRDREGAGLWCTRQELNLRPLV